MVTTATRHDWELVGPWYRWEKEGTVHAGIPEVGRTSSPIFQKYASPDFVNAFLADPQLSLRWSPDEDVVDGATTRKLFLETHNRFYLVVCELHCDAPGFPRADRDDVCEAGFMVRRRSLRIAPEVRKEVARIGKELRRVRTQRRIVAGRSKARKTRRRKVASAPVGDALEARWADQLSRMDEDAAHLRVELARFRRDQSITTTVQGWFPSEHDGLGGWYGIETAPPDREEDVFPLYPLVPDPADEENSGHRGTLWFGVVPVGSSDVDEGGNSRFDDRHAYQVECFVRRHDPRCPKKRNRRDCKGELEWAAPTERYQLASHFDFDGTAHKPVMVQLPDIEDLRAKVAGMPIGKGVGVGMISPPDSSLNFDVTDGTTLPTGGSRGSDTEICFFAIPLITIVAMFLLKIFLPILVFLFQLWFLLKLKFCIPPSLSIDAGLAADLEVELGGIDFEFDASVDIDAGFAADLATVFSSNPVRADLKAGLDATNRLADMADYAVNQSKDFSASLPGDLQDEIVVDPSITSGSGVLEIDPFALDYYPREEWPFR